MLVCGFQDSSHTHQHTYPHTTLFGEVIGKPTARGCAPVENRRVNLSTDYADCTD